MEKGNTYFSQAENVPYCSHLRTAFATAILHNMEDRTIFCSQCHSPLHVRTVGNIEDPVFILYFVCNCERQSPAEIEALPLAA